MYFIDDSESPDSNSPSAPLSFQLDAAARIRVVAQAMDGGFYTCPGLRIDSLEVPPGYG